MSSSDSQTQNQTSTATSLTTKNLNVSGNSGLTAVGGENGSLSLSYAPTTIDASTTTTTDFGSVKAATGLASHALDIVAAVNSGSNDLVANLASKSITATGNAYGAALTAVQDNADHTVDVITGLASQFAGKLSDFEGQSQAQLGNVVSALSSTYQDNTTNANTQVINATTGVVKYVAAAAVIGIVIFLVLRK